MADKKHTFTNRGQGPRSFFDAEGVGHVLRPGETYTGTIQGDRDDLSGDLVKGKGEAPAPATAPASPNPTTTLTGKALQAVQDEAEKLAADNDRDALVKIAADENVDGITDELEPADIALRIATARATAKK